MKKRYLISIVAIILILLFAIFRVGLDFQGEDSWIKDSRGVYVKHGVPSETPDYVLEQQNAINCSNELYNENKNLNLSSECLGTCGDYMVDVIHVPRNSDDDLIENQCEDFRNGNAGHFIELNKDGSIVRVV